MIWFIFLIYHLVGCTLKVSALFSFSANGAIHTYSTYDPAGMRVKPYNITGLLLKPTFALNAPCQLKFEMPLDIADRSVTSPKAANASILVVDQKITENSGCQTLAHVSLTR
jgi:hypothetical protein